MTGGVPATVNIKLEVGAATETVEVVGGAEIVQTSSAAVSSTIGGRQIFELPFATRNAVELLVTQPGVQTPTNPRSSSVNGLPRGALNVTIDGMNTQDNMLKSSDGFFSYIYPTVDSLDELARRRLNSPPRAVPTNSMAAVFTSGGRRVGTPTTISIISRACRAIS